MLSSYSLGLEDLFFWEAQGGLLFLHLDMSDMAPGITLSIETPGKSPHT